LNKKYREVQLYISYKTSYKTTVNRSAIKILGRVSYVTAGSHIQSHLLSNQINGWESVDSDILKYNKTAKVHSNLDSTYCLNTFLVISPQRPCSSLLEIKNYYQ
jgi:hypothetical protein